MRNADFRACVTCMARVACKLQPSVLHPCCGLLSLSLLSGVCHVRAASPTRTPTFIRLQNRGVQEGPKGLTSPRGTREGESEACRALRMAIKGGEATVESDVQYVLDVQDVEVCGVIDAIEGLAAAPHARVGQSDEGDGAHGGALGGSDGALLLRELGRW